MPRSPSAKDWVVRPGPRRTGLSRFVSRLPILGDVRLDRRLGWVIPVFIVLVTAIVGYNAQATAHERGSALVVNIASRQRTLVERYTKDVMLVIDGFQADPDQSGAILHQTADALLNGGSVAAPQGNDDRVGIPAQRDPKVRRKLDQDRRLIEELTRTGDDLLERGRADPDYTAKVTRLRVLSAQLSSVSNDAVGEITRHTEASLSRLVLVEIILGLLSALSALAMGLLLRRAGAEQAAQFRSLVHHSSDLITVVAGDGTIRYQSPSVERMLGRRAADLVGMNLIALVHPDDQHHLTAALAKLAETQEATTDVECRLQHGDGSWRHAESICTNLVDDPRVGGLVLNIRDVTDRTALQQQLTHQAFHDPLTGLANRALFSDRVDHALARAGRQGPAAAVVFLDLDDFKTINDTRRWPRPTFGSVIPESEAKSSNVSFLSVRTPGVSTARQDHGGHMRTHDIPTTIRRRRRRGLLAGIAGAALLALSIAAASPRMLQAAAAADDPVLAVGGDIACAPGTTANATRCQQTATGNVVAGIDPDYVLPLGDSQYENGSDAEYAGAYAKTVWGADKGISRPAAGNHEYRTAGATPYYSYFGANAGDPAKGYYSWNVTGPGNAFSWHMIALNSECAQLGGAASPRAAAPAPPRRSGSRRTWPPTRTSARSPTGTARASPPAPPRPPRPATWPSGTTSTTPGRTSSSTATPTTTSGSPPRPAPARPTRPRGCGSSWSAPAARTSTPWAPPWPTRSPPT
jgi:PAS domain S-box-containing protein